MIRAVVFDLDDTLLDTFKPACENLKEIAQSWSLSRKPKLNMPNPEEFSSNYRGQWSEWVKALWPDLQHCFEEFESFYREHKPARVYPAIAGAHDALEFVCNNGYCTGILTSRSTRSLRKRLEEAGLNRFRFDFVHNADGEYRKPDPKAFSPVVSEIRARNIELADAAYVGDQIIDMSCKEAGMGFVAVCTGSTTRQTFLDAGVHEYDVLGSVKDLPSYLKVR